MQSESYETLKNKLAQYESGDLPTWKSEYDVIKDVCDSLDKSNQELQKDLEIVRDSHRRQYQLNDALTAKLDKAVEALKEIAKDTYEANPWTVVNTMSARKAKETLRELGG